MTRRKTMLRLAIALGAGIIATTVGFEAAGVTINTTPSVPVGFYRLSDGPAERGALVLFCPPDVPVFTVAKDRHYLGGGWCPGGYERMIKRILAAKGDDIDIGPEGVAVNGVPLPHSRPLTTDPVGRPMPQLRWHHRLQSSAILTMTDDNDFSFDSRYYGPIDRAQVVGVLRPVWTW